MLNNVLVWMIRCVSSGYMFWCSVCRFIFRLVNRNSEEMFRVVSSLIIVLCV